MTDCAYCGAPLIGAKRFCVRCGREQKGAASTARKSSSSKPEGKSKLEKTTEQECHKCGEVTERICYFCNKPICVRHTNKMQANVLPPLEYKTAYSMGDSKRINNGWRGFIVPACPRCASMNDGRTLSENERIDIRTIDQCSWFELRHKTSKY